MTHLHALDTNIVIQLMNGREPRLRERFDEARRGGVPMAVSAIVLFELRFGMASGARLEANTRALDLFLSDGLDVLVFDGEDASHAGDIRAYLEPRGTPIGRYDILIAAQARRRGAVLVSANRREFERVPGLMVTDWTTA